MTSTATTPTDLKNTSLAFATYALMAAFAFIFVFPFLFMLASSLKDNAGIFADVRSLRAILPVGDIATENYVAVFKRGNIGHFLGNSLFITIVTVVSGLFVNSLAAFALARLEWRGKQAALTVLVVLLAIPLEAISVPMMMVVARLPGLNFSDGIALTQSWLDTRYVQIVPFVANAFSVFLFYQFFRDIPKDFDEAAYIDGATPFQVYRHIVVPSSLPVFATVAILQSLAMWNQYLWPAITVPGQEARPLMIGMQQFFSARRVAWGEVMAYASVITVPVLIAFVIFQRWFVRSVIGSGVKG